jgi:hypothetical protein
MIGEVRYIWHSSGALEGHTQKNGAVSIVNSFASAPFFCVCPVLAPVLTSSAFLRSLYNLHRSALVNLGFYDSFWICLSNDIRFLHFCSYFLYNLSTLWKFSSTQHTYRLVTLQNLFYRLLLLNNIVDPVIIYTSTPISTSFLFAIQSYTAQTPLGVAIYSVHAQALPLPPSPLHTPTTHHFRYGHQPSIQQNSNHFIIIYSLRDISATNLAIFLVARVFVETPLHRTEFKDVFTSKLTGVSTSDMQSEGTQFDTSILKRLSCGFHSFFQSFDLMRLQNFNRSTDRIFCHSFQCFTHKHFLYNLTLTNLYNQYSTVKNPET